MWARRFTAQSCVIVVTHSQIVRLEHKNRYNNEGNKRNSGTTLRVRPMLNYVVIRVIEVRKSSDPASIME